MFRIKSETFEKMIRFKQDYYESDGDIIESRKKLITNWEPKREVYENLFCNIMHKFYVNITEIIKNLFKLLFAIQML